MLQAPEGMGTLFRGSSSHLSFYKDVRGLSVSSSRALLLDRCSPAEYFPLEGSSRLGESQDKLDKWRRGLASHNSPLRLVAPALPVKARFSFEADRL